ncbi:GSCOCG00001023001-RA-CDS [Cotesia congregata]|nr:GSCOCG00001023001-RA-CDS [Cotesia congregata]
MEPEECNVSCPPFGCPEEPCPGQFRNTEVCGFINILPSTKPRCVQPESRVLPNYQSSVEICYPPITLYTSEYKNFLLNHEEKKSNSSCCSTKLTFSDTKCSRTFKIVPTEIIFRQYIPGNIYNTPLTITNIDKSSHVFRLTYDKNSPFDVNAKKMLINQKLAPGMSLNYNIKFIPEEKKDYYHQLDVVTDCQTFSVPLIAIGPRALLDFPDQIWMPETAVKIPSSKIFLIQNIGNRNTAFTSFSESEYFSIEPESGMIMEKEAVQFSVNFIASNSGNFYGIIYLQYDTGELIRIDAKANAVNCNIYLNNDQLRIEDTFIGLLTNGRLKIHNDSDYLVEFQWVKYKNPETNICHKEKLTEIFGATKNTKSTEYAGLEHDICRPEVYKSIYERIYTDEMTSLLKENFTYSNNHFSITPIKGKILPRSFTNVIVDFQPTSVGNLMSTAYLEVTGRVERIPKFSFQLILRLSGVSKGPVIKFKNPIINIGDVYIFTAQNVQAICKNEGLVTGTLSYKTKLDDDNCTINVTPEQQKIRTEEFSSFNITFSSSKYGQFTEMVDFKIEESDEIITLCIRGNSILPALNFDKTHLNCGTTALGFTSKHEVTLLNDSPVSIKLNLTIPDGNEPPVTYESFTYSAPNLVSNPKEFFIKPQQFILNAKSSRNIIINFTPNVARVSNTCLKVKFDGFDSTPVTLPIVFKSEAASLEIEPSSHVVELCYINFPFTLHFTIKNKSDIEGFAYNKKQSSKNSAIFYSMSRQLWHLKSNEFKCSSVTLIATKYGRQSIEIPIITFGSLYPQILTIAYNCQGATVLSIPSELDWGEVQLLEKKSMSFKLVNYSPVPAYFKAIISNSKSPWSLSPTSGEINPLKSENITATIFMRESKQLCNSIFVSVLNSLTVTIVLKAFGIGLPIIIDPNIFPTFDMGCFFNKQKKYLSLMVTNEGNQLQKIFFSSIEIKMMESDKLITHSKKFLVEPFLIDLLPRNKQKIKCVVYSEKIGNISEEWWIYSLLPGQKMYELIGKSLFSAKFIKPLINFNKNKLSFFINIGSNSEESSEKLIDEIEVTNTSELNLQAHVSIRAPFSLLTDKNLYTQSIVVNFCHNLASSIQICFIPLINDSQYSSKIYRDMLKFEYEYPKVDEIECEAAIIYPNIIIDPDSLQFDLILGSIVEKEITLTNEGPVTAYYQFYWANENIEYLKIKSVSLTSVNSQTKLTTDEMDLQNGFQIFKRKLSEERVDNFIKLLPIDGFVPPFSKKLITCTFYTQDPLLIKAKLQCQVLKGPLISIEVEAKADTVRYHLSTKNINFGNKLIFQYHYEKFTLKNVCNIQIDYKLYILPQESQNPTRIFSINPKKGFIKSGETAVITLQYKPIIPGYVEEFFYLDIENLSPIKISMQCHGIFPQVYLPLPRANNDNLICDEYCALQYFEDLNNNKELNNKKNSSQIISEADLSRLTSNGWYVVNCYELPQIVDIKMFIERHFATEFIKKNNTPLYDYIVTYVLNLGYVVIDQLTSHSLTILNYSSCKLFIEMKQPKSQKYLSKYGITIKFENRILEPAELCVLEISINPSSKILLDKTGEIRREIFIEVAHGCTVSILIIGVITFPSLKTNTNYIDFESIFIGECKETPLLIENDGLIDCRWRIKLSDENKMSNSFYLIETEGITSPKQHIVINIHFKPHKSGYHETDLIIFIEQSCESIKIKLIGRGVERKLNISEPSIDFFANLHGSSKEHIFYIENPNVCPIEFYWEHLDKISNEENKIIRALLTYYQANEIFLPITKIAAQLPQKLYEFYYDLVDNATSRNIKKNINNLSEEFDNANNSCMTSEFKDVKESISCDETESLIYSYINNLHNQDDFWKTRKDPIKEINDDYYYYYKLLTNKICIVFHGAPFTSYQETACRAARKINLPLLNLNTEITEFIALKKSPSAIKIKEIIYQKYEVLLATVKDQLENFEFTTKINDSTHKEKIYNQEVKINKLKNEYLFNFSKPKINDLIDSLQTIPSIEELHSMDPFSCLEYKIEGINLIESIINCKKKLLDKSSIKIKKRRSKSKHEETFLDIDINLFKEILKEILESDNFRKGFVLQTLANNFIKNQVEVFSLIINHSSINVLFFVTFDNSLELYERKLMENLTDEIGEKNKTLDTSNKTFPLASNHDFEDQSVIIEKNVDPIIKNVEQNYSEKLFAVNKNHRKSDSESNIYNKQESKRKLKSPKSQSLCEPILFKLSDKEDGIKKKKKSKSVAKAFNNYNSNLKSMLRIIDNWTSASDMNDGHRWHAKFSDPWDLRVYDLIINQLLEMSDFINKLSIEQMRGPNLNSKFYRILTKTQQRKLSNSDDQVFKLYSLPNFSSSDMSGTQVEDVEPRSAMQPGEVKYFKIVFNPENIGTFRREFFLGIIGNDKIYSISVNGIVDNPIL